MVLVAWLFCTTMADTMINADILQGQARRAILVTGGQCHYHYAVTIGNSALLAINCNSSW
jgi:hypothetical protein